MIGFEYGDPHRHVKFVLTMPKATDADIRFNGRGTERTELQVEKELAKEEKRRWRALLLVVKAKLEAVETGIATFEDEFLAYTVLPGGKTVGEIVTPKLSRVYQTGEVGRLLPMDD